MLKYSSVIADWGYPSDMALVWVCILFARLGILSDINKHECFVLASLEGCLNSP